MRTPETAVVGRCVVFAELHSQDQAEANEMRGSNHSDRLFCFLGLAQHQLQTTFAGRWVGVGRVGENCGTIPDLSTNSGPKLYEQIKANVIVPATTPELFPADPGTLCWSSSWDRAQLTQRGVAKSKRKWRQGPVAKSASPNKRPIWLSFIFGAQDKSTWTQWRIYGPILISFCAKLYWSVGYKYRLFVILF